VQSALQRQRDFFLSAARPTNPFLTASAGAGATMGAAASDRLESMRPALSHDAILSREQAHIRDVVRRQEIKQARFDAQEERTRVQQGIISAHSDFGDGFAADAGGGFSLLPRPPVLQLAGVDPEAYRPSPLFSATTQEVMGNPYYSEPTPSGDFSSMPAGAGGVIGSGAGAVDPSQFLKRGGGRHEAAQAEIGHIRARVSSNILSDYARHVADPSLSGGVSNAIAGVPGLRGPTTSSAAGSGASVAATPAGGPPKAIQLQLLDLFGADAGLSRRALGDAQRMRRSLPYAVRLSFRSPRLRVTRASLDYFFALLPGVVSVERVLFSPDMRQAFVHFHYNRFEHTMSAVAAATGEAGPTACGSTLSSTAGVECDGVQAVRRHVEAVTADLPSPYVATHRSRIAGAFLAAAAAAAKTAAGSVDGGDAADVAAAEAVASASASAAAAYASEMGILLRALFLHCIVDESSAAQMEALSARWRSGHSLPHVADPSVLIGGGARQASAVEDQADDSAVSTSLSIAAASAAHPDSFMAQDTAHMFTAGGIGVGRPAAGSLTARRPAHARKATLVAHPRKPGMPQLEWADGLFTHVQREQQKAAFINSNNNCNSGAATARTSAEALPPSSRRRVALPQPNTGRGPAAPSSLAQAPGAPPPASTPWILGADKDWAEAIGKDRNAAGGGKGGYAARAAAAAAVPFPSAVAAALAAAADSASSLFVPRSRFFKSDGSGESKEAEQHLQRQQRADQQWLLTSAAQQQQEHLLSNRRGDAANGGMSARVAANLKWSLTAQLEGVRA
jgi:hypothetical protein